MGAESLDKTEHETPSRSSERTVASVATAVSISRRLPLYLGAIAVPLAAFFFFQAEDGIRDGHVTGVQTCALPILAVLAAFALPQTTRLIAPDLRTPYTL